jgi:hypothetical protein
MEDENVLMHHVDMNINKIYLVYMVVNDDLIMNVNIQLFYPMIL